MSQQPDYNLLFDGLVRVLEVDQSIADRPGLMAYGWIITYKNQLIARGYGTYADTRQATSNRAEYLALIEGLEALLDLNVGNECIQISGDAKCVIDQLNETKPVKSVATIPLYLRASHLLKRFSRVEFQWIPRKNNREADRLTRYALHQLQQDQSTFQGTLRAISRNDQLNSKNWLFPVLDIRVYQRHKAQMILG
jgi:ribonuclease HI